MRALKPKSCRACKTEFTPHNSTTVVCSMDCAIEYARDKSERQRKTEFRKARARQRKSDRQRKRELRPHREWLKDAQKAFNRYIRLRDCQQPCISCNRPPHEIENEQGWKLGGAWDCGHFLSVGSHPELRFEELNAHRQCKGCNGGAGRFRQKERTVSEEYRKHLANRIGRAQVEWLEGPHEPRKYSREDLERIAVEYRDKAKRLEEVS